MKLINDEQLEKLTEMITSIGWLRGSISEYSGSIGATKEELENKLQLQELRLSVFIQELGA